MTTFETPAPISAIVDVPVGDVRINAVDPGATAVDVQPSDPSSDEDVAAAEATRVEYANGQLLVKAPKSRSWRIRGTGGSLAVTIELPAGSTLHGAGQLTDFTAEGRLGECRAKTGMGDIRLDQVETLNLRSGIGDITVERAAGHADIATGSGDVRVRALDAGGVVKNSNGDTWVGTAGRHLRISAANGGIAVDLAQATVVAKSSNGDVRLGEAVSGTVVLETRLGDLEVGIREGTAAWLDVRANAGKVHNALEAAGAPEPSAETVEVRGRTTAGDIVIGRAR